MLLPRLPPPWVPGALFSGRLQPCQGALDGSYVPSPSPGGMQPCGIQRFSNSAHRMSGADQTSEPLNIRLKPIPGVGLVLFAEDLCVPTQSDAASFRCGESLFRPPADLFRFLLSQGGKQVKLEPVRMRHVGGHEWDASFHEPAHKVNVASEAVDLGDHESSSFTFRKGKRLSQLRPAGERVCSLSGFHLDEFSDLKASAAGEIARDRFALSLAAEPGRTLL